MNAGELDVLVLGGGIAGLTCALGLRDTGLRVAVVEREPILGGRARSWIDETTGDPVHLGPHVVTSFYPSFFKLLDEVGTRERIVWQSPELMYALYEGRRFIELRSSRLPAPFNFMRVLGDDPELDTHDILSAMPLTHLALGRSEEDLRALDAHEARPMLESLGVSDGLMRRYFEFASLSIMNVPLDRCSAGALMRGYKNVASHECARVGFPGCGLGDLFAPGARAALEAAGTDVWTDTRVTALLHDGDRITGVRLGEREVGARHVVSTLPPAALAELVPAEWHRHPLFASLPRFSPVPYVSVTLWLDRKITERAFWARAYSSDDLNCDFYDYSNIYPGYASRPSLVCSNIIYAQRVAHLSDAEIVERTHRELAENLAEAEGARVVHAVVNRIPLAVQAPLCGFEAMRPQPETPISGLTLAGDWTQTRLPSSMESAAYSGWRAAEIVCAVEGRPRKLALRVPPPERLASAIGSLSRVTPWPRQIRRFLSRE